MPEPAMAGTGSRLPPPGRRAFRFFYSSEMESQEVSKLKLLTFTILISKKYPEQYRDIITSNYFESIYFT